MFRNWASNPLKILSTERFKSSVCKTVRCPFASIYWLFYLKLPYFLSREGEKTRSDRFSCNKDFQCRGAVKTFVGNILHQWVCLLLFHDLWFAWDFSVVGWQRRLEVFWDNICLSCGRPWPRAGWRRRRETITSCFYARIKCCDGRRRPGAVLPLLHCSSGNLRDFKTNLRTSFTHFFLGRFTFYYLWRLHPPSNFGILHLTTLHWSIWMVEKALECTYCYNYFIFSFHIIQDCWTHPSYIHISFKVKLEF